MRNEDDTVKPGGGLGAVMTALTRPLEIEEAVEEYGKGTCKLVGADGNAFAIIGRVRRSLKIQGWPDDKLSLVQDEMMSSDYDHLIRTAFEICKDEGGFRP